MRGPLTAVTIAVPDIRAGLGERFGLAVDALLSGTAQRPCSANPRSRHASPNSNCSPKLGSSASTTRRLNCG